MSEQIQQKKRVWSFDFLKLFLALIMCIYHVFPGTAGWYIFVEFYFMISGVFVVKSAINHPQNTFKYIFKKWWTMFPYLFVVSTSFFLGNVITAGINHSINVNSFFWTFYLWISDTIPILFFYYMNGVVWYIGATLIASFLIYPISKKLKNKYSFLWLILSVALYSVLFSLCKQADPFHISSLSIFARYGFNILRGVAGISMGIFIALTSAQIKEKYKDLKSSIQIIHTVLFIILIVTVVVMPIFKQNTLFDIMYIGLFCFALFIMVNKCGYLSNHLNLPNPKFISDYSLTLFLTHWMLGPVFNPWKINIAADAGCLFLIYLIAAAYTVVIILFNKLIKKMESKIKERRSKKASQYD